MIEYSVDYLTRIQEVFNPIEDTGVFEDGDPYINSLNTINFLAYLEKRGFEIVPIKYKEDK